MKQLNVTELSHWLSDPAQPRPQMLDVREPWEHQICRIDGADLVPMQRIPAHAAALDPEQPIVCICHHGGRSAQVAMFLTRHGFGDVYNLAGGVDAWARQVDRSMATY
jgi:rhodanese-related sulfurtransferase